MMAVLGYVAGVGSDMLIKYGTSVTATRKIMQVCRELIPLSENEKEKHFLLLEGTIVTYVPSIYWRAFVLILLVCFYNIVFSSLSSTLSNMNLCAFGLCYSYD